MYIIIPSPHICTYVRTCGHFTDTTMHTCTHMYTHVHTCTHTHTHAHTHTHTLSSAGQGPGPCHVCWHVLQKGNPQFVFSHTTTSDFGSESVRALQRGQNTMPGMESSSTFSLIMMYLQRGGAYTHTYVCLHQSISSQWLTSINIQQWWTTHDDHTTVVDNT